MEITVSEPEKRTVTSMKVQDTFYVYLIETRWTFFFIITIWQWFCWKTKHVRRWL